MPDSAHSHTTNLVVPSLQLKGAPALPLLSPDSITRTLEEEKRPLNRNFMLILLSSFNKVTSRASSSDNERWHSMFRTIPAWDTLLASYDCVLHRGDNNIKQLMFPYVGELFISGKYLCFATKNYQFGWLFTRLQISLFEIVNIHKLVDGIIVETNLGKIQLNAFTDLDAVYHTLHLVWKENSLQTRGLDNEPLQKNNQTLLEMIQDTFTDIRYNGPKKLEDKYMNSESKLLRDAQDDMIDEIIHSIDGDDTVTDGNEVVNESKPLQRQVPIYKLKSDQYNHSFQFDGPLFNESYQDVVKPGLVGKNELILQDIQYKVSPGLLFELLFSESDTKFLMDTYGKANCTDIEIFGKFINEKRVYSYSKPLNFSIGPKSTKCEVMEEIVHYDPENYIELISTTRTPNIPSGNSFNIKTRYLMWWTDDNKCNLQLSYWVEWTSSSWIKNMIETSCKTGVMESLAIFNETLSEYLEKYIECSVGDTKTDIETNNDIAMAATTDKISEILDTDSNIVDTNTDIDSPVEPQPQVKILQKEMATTTTARIDTKATLTQNTQSNTIIALLALNLMVMLYLVWLTKTQPQPHASLEVFPKRHR